MNMYACDYMCENMIMRVCESVFDDLELISWVFLCGTSILFGVGGRVPLKTEFVHSG